MDSSRRKFLKFGCHAAAGGFLVFTAKGLLPGDEPRVSCGSGALALGLVQPEGRPVLPAADWRRGLRRDHVLLGAVRP